MGRELRDHRRSEPESPEPEPAHPPACDTPPCGCLHCVRPTARREQARALDVHIMVHQFKMPAYRTESSKPDAPVVHVSYHDGARCHSNLRPPLGWALQGGGHGSGQPNHAPTPTCTRRPLQLRARPGQPRHLRLRHLRLRPRAAASAWQASRHRCGQRGGSPEAEAAAGAEAGGLSETMDGLRIDAPREGGGGSDGGGGGGGGVGGEDEGADGEGGDDGGGDEARLSCKQDRAKLKEEKRLRKEERHKRRAASEKAESEETATRTDWSSAVISL